MKQIILILTLLVVALTPVAAQVQIDTGLTPSENAEEIVRDDVSAMKLLDYLMLTAADDSCVESPLSDGFYKLTASACVFHDPIDPRVILVATLTGGSYSNVNIYLLRDGSLFRVARRSEGKYNSFMFVGDLPDGEYEVVFVWDLSDRQVNTAFYFWIDEQKEDSN